MRLNDPILLPDLLQPRESSPAARTQEPAKKCKHQLSSRLGSARLAECNDGRESIFCEPSSEVSWSSTHLVVVSLDELRSELIKSIVRIYSDGRSQIIEAKRKFVSFFIWISSLQRAVATRLLELLLLLLLASVEMDCGDAKKGRK